MAQPRYPVPKFDIPRTGHFGDVRESAKDGECPTGYPCRHWGVDLATAPKTPIVAPHDGWVLGAMMVPRGMKLPPPFVGYEPGVVLIAHDDVDAPSVAQRFVNAVTWTKNPQAARYTLLGHVVTQWDMPLDPRVWRDEDKANWAKQSDGTVAMLFKPGGDRSEIQPGDTSPKARYVQAGDTVGYISPDARHVHWEVRSSPLAGPDGRLDPMAMFQEFYGLGAPEESDFPWLLALAAAAYIASK